MNVRIESEGEVLYLDVTKLAVIQMQKPSEKLTQHMELGSMILHYTTGQTLTITLPWKTLYEVRDSLDRAMTRQSPPLDYPPPNAQIN